MSEERQKKSEAAWEAEEDEELNESRAFDELTEYIANAVENDILAELHELYLLCIAHFALSQVSTSSKLVLCYN